MHRTTLVFKQISTMATTTAIMRMTLSARKMACMCKVEDCCICKKRLCHDNDGKNNEAACMLMPPCPHLRFALAVALEPVCKRKLAN